MMEKALRKKGLNLDGRYIVKMVDTYTLMFDLSDEEKCEKVMKDAEVCIDRVIEKVVNRVRGDFDNRKIPRFSLYLLQSKEIDCPFRGIRSMYRMWGVCQEVSDGCNRNAR